MAQDRPGMFDRLRSLFRGLFGSWVRGREQERPEVVYEQAIAERVRQYRELKEAVAGILYMRNKLESEIAERRAEIARLHDDVRRAVRRGEEESALALIAHKQALFEELERAEQELDQVRAQGEEAKTNLVRYREEIRALVREKGRMLATLANARARRRLQAAIEGLSVDAEMDALENVREHISRVVMESEVNKELGGEGDAFRERLRGFRDEARRESARAELESLQRELLGRALPAEAAREPMPAAAG
ncbi:MAG: PspA/IM30 family protein [Deltaproteobacteria bacterium]|nr:PspA/IM30 family protein [Deltaproteobacteria bacterium]MBW2498209.1 PspA/IM30 family protein [Deltaproteobacteria bacterium]